MNEARTTAIKSAYFGIIINSILALVKVITGILGNSYALIADGIESTTDIFASILVLFGIKYSTKPADKNHPYGHGRAEALFTFIEAATYFAKQRNSSCSPVFSSRHQTGISIRVFQLFRKISTQ